MLKKRCLAVYVTLTIDTAHEYVKLGRAEKAASILTHVLPTIRAGTLPQDVAILFLLRYSETLAAAGEVLKAYVFVTRYSRCA